MLYPVLSAVQFDAQKKLSLYLRVARTPSLSLDASIVLPLDAGDVPDEEVSADAAHVWDQQAAGGKIEEKERVKLILWVASLQGKFVLCQKSYIA